jgi:nucleotide-binding universal stress UspA family protein
MVAEDREITSGANRETCERMSLPKNILVPIDFSEGSIAALDYACELATKLDAKIHLLNVVGLQMMGAEFGVTMASSVVDTVYGANQKALAQLVSARAAKASFAKPLLETGDARLCIEETALKIGADLIIMGTHGRRGVRRLLIGSVAESVVRVAPCPVLLVRNEAAS